MKFYKNFKSFISYENCSCLIVWTIKYTGWTRSRYTVIYNIPTFGPPCIYSNFKGKRKVGPVKDMKAYGGSKCIAPLILHIDVR